MPRASVRTMARKVTIGNVLLLTSETDVGQRGADLPGDNSASELALTERRVAPRTERRPMYVMFLITGLYAPCSPLSLSSCRC
jgi:hypothetical protein